MTKVVKFQRNLNISNNILENLLPSRWEGEKFSKKPTTPTYHTTTSKRISTGADRRQKYSEFSRGHTHITDECRSLKVKIEKLIQAEHLRR